MTLIDRTVYSTFMLLSDVGGLSGLLISVGSSIVSLLTFKNPENKLVEKLFVVNPPEDIKLESGK